MLVLIATTDPHGTVASDHQLAADGELVVPSLVDCADRHCELCSRVWLGLISDRVTTTAMVVDRPHISASDLRRLVHESLDRQGVIDQIVQAADAGEYEVNGITVDDPVTAVADLVDAHIREVRQICQHFAKGTIVSRMGTLVSPRVMRRAA
jgi:hypothetical protein